MPNTAFYPSISIHALRGEGDPSPSTEEGSKEISIHALRGEGDFNSSCTLKFPSEFQSTPSEGRATRPSRA